jgi:parallel beta-helix repeat protein
MRRLGALLLLGLLCSCGGEVTLVKTVRPGESIQAAIDAAAPNSTIMVEPGVYRESPGAENAITITKDGIRLIGQSTPTRPVTLENAGGQKNGIWVSPADSVGAPDDEHPPCGANGKTVRDFTLQGFTVQGFDQFGVYLACNDGYTLRQDVSDGNMVYGLFPVRSHNGIVTGNEAKNTPLDAAIYVGQSDHISITNNVAHDSLIGIEVENSSQVQATQNRAFNNTIGIIADVLPGLQKKDQEDVLIADNDSYDNNRPNSGEPGDLTATIPSGTGILVVTGSTTTVRGNRVSNNNFAGIALAGYCTAATLAGVPCTGLDINPDPTNDQVVDNQLGGNGLHPPMNPILAAVAGDLVWDNSGTDNCWVNNTPLPPATGLTEITLDGSPLPACP